MQTKEKGYSYRGVRHMGPWDETEVKAAGNALYDKREALAEKDAAQDVERVVKRRFQA